MVARAIVLLAALGAGCSFDAGGGRPALDRTRAVADALRPDLALRSPDLALSDQPRLEPDQRLQGTSCAASNYSFLASAPPTQGAALALTVYGAARVWVLGGIATVAAQGPLDFTWHGQAKVFSGGWTFQVKVPAKPGPYLFGFMADAENDDPTKGTLVAKCLP